MGTLVAIPFAIFLKSLGVFGFWPISEPNVLVSLTGSLIVVFDLIYIGMLFQTKAIEKNSKNIAANE